MFQFKRFAAALLALALLMAGCASAQAAFPIAGSTWYGGENYNGARQYTLYITETTPESFSFEFSALRIGLYDDCGASLDWDGKTYFGIYEEEIPVMGGEVIFFDNPNMLALRFDFSIADYLEELSGQTILFERG